MSLVTDHEMGDGEGAAGHFSEPGALGGGQEGLPLVAGPT